MAVLLSSSLRACRIDGKRRGYFDVNVVLLEAVHPFVGFGLESFSVTY